MSNYKQLSYEQRCQIYVLLGTHLTQKEMAASNRVRQATISREIKRRGVIGLLSRKALERRPQSTKPTKMTEKVIIDGCHYLCALSALRSSVSGAASAF